MAAHAARRLLRMCENLSVILGVEAMCAAQGVETRAPLHTSARLQAAMTVFRAAVPTLAEDRYMAGDIQAAAAAVAKGYLAKAAGVELAL